MNIYVLNLLTSKHCNVVNTEAEILKNLDYVTLFNSKFKI